MRKRREARARLRSGIARLRRAARRRIVGSMHQSLCAHCALPRLRLVRRGAAVEQAEEEAAHEATEADEADLNKQVVRFHIS